MRRAGLGAHRARLACALALAALGALPATAAARTVTAEEGAVAAELSFQEVSSGPLPYSRLQLQISRSGIPYYDAPASSPHCGEGCFPGSIGAGPQHDGPLAVSDLEGNGQSQVVLGLYTGGAHCCSVVQVFSLDPGTMAYGLVEHDFGDPGALLTELEGHSEPVFESGDDRFAYEFAPYAGSALPLQVWRFREGRFANVTSSYPKAIAADAKQLFKGFLQARGEHEGNGVIAAWAADEYELGHRAAVVRVLAREAAAGHLRSREHYGPSGSAYVKALMRFLKRTGYR